MSLRIGPPASVGRSSEDEHGLVQAAKSGSEQAIRTLIEQHWPTAYRAAYLIVQDSAAAEDVTQESMLALVDSLPRFDKRRPIAPWLRRIVVNSAIDHARRLQRTHEVAADIELIEAEAPAVADEPLPDRVLLALRSLDPEDRALVVYRHLWGFYPREIAKATGVNVATIRTRIHRATKRLREQLEEGVGSED